MKPTRLIVVIKQNVSILNTNEISIRIVVLSQMATPALGLAN